MCEALIYAAEGSKTEYTCSLHRASSLGERKQMHARVSLILGKLG